MDLIADILLVAGALGAGFYCFILGRRLNRFNDLENGVGGAVAVLSAQVDDLTKTLAAAQSAAAESAHTLTALTNRAEDSSRKLELQMASLHDIPLTPKESNAVPDDSVRVPDVPHKPSEPMFTRHKAGATA
tara:strand:- start:1421 stop:1816 length:396 start_codon:yes stop_codon:yes gene_type:complete